VQLSHIESRDPRTTQDAHTNMNIPEFDEIIEQNDQTAARREHLQKLREIVGNVYPNKFERSSISGTEDTITNLLAYPPVKSIAAEIGDVVAKLAERERPPAEIKDGLNARLKELGNVRISGRMAVPPRVMGKAAFVHLSDGMSRVQIYCRKDDFVLLRNDSNDAIDPTDSWAAFALLDHGDFIGVEGFLFVTNTGELSVHVEKLQFLSKAMLPMPDKMHGIADPEIRQRQRYADLIASSLQIEHESMTTREVFERRAKVISSLRRSLEDQGYIEVETPMLTPKATGAAAKPFETHHNALDITLYARIAPELYLKRLVVGGFEKVYELNRNFRNEGISYKHNPEFTMLEFYCAYMDVNGMMDFCEEMLRESVQKATGGLKVNYEGNEIDFSKFKRITMREAVEQASGSNGGELSDSALLEAFENNVEPNLIQPTFIIDFPKSISPLSKASPDNPNIAERFELFINGMEVANGFSELNDPKEQYERFVDQMSERERGDEEAMVLDEDYIRALSYGMPPAAGIGIGIDRLVMLLTNKHSIRDVILFPHLRPERKSHEAEEPAPDKLKSEN
jgi:lysyl-tRNA synthetase class 2